MESDITVVIPAYNAKHTIERTLESILAQTHPPAQIIVIDDGSIDGTSDIVLRHAINRIMPCSLISISNSGVSHARNTGILAASTGHIALLDADDEFKPEHLATLESAINCHPDAVVYWSGITRAFADGAKLESGTLPDFSEIARRHAISGSQILEIGPTVYKDLIRGNFIPTSAAVFKRVVDNEIRLFDTTLSLGEDRLFFLETMSLGKAIFVDLQTSIIHRDGTNASVTIDRAKLAAMIEKRLLTLTAVGQLACIKSDQTRLSVWQECVEAALRDRIYQASLQGPRQTLMAIKKSLRAPEFRFGINAGLMMKAMARATKHAVTKPAK